MAIRGLASRRPGRANRPDQPDRPDRPATDPEPARPTPEPAPLAAALLTAGLGLTKGLRMRSPGTGSRQRWFFSGIWLVYLAAPVSELFHHHHGAAWIAGGVAITVVFAAAYLPTLVAASGRPRLALAGLATVTALAALACVVYGYGWAVLWIYVSAAVGMVLTNLPGGQRLAFRGVLAVVACYCFFSWLTHNGWEDTVVVLLPVLFVGVAMIGFRMQIQLMHELGQARETVAKLAANTERLRLARDMHDLTGQSLSTITLKAELAAKRLTRLEPSAERDMVLGDLGDIGQVSRQTLHDIREAVSGYRRPTLAIEAITAQNALEAAGIGLDDDAALTLRSGTFDADAEAVLAWCLREAVTNVIRHSGARNCRIRLTERPGELSLEVADDGHGPSQPQPEASKGSGLRGMSERLSPIGGHLSLGPADPGHGHENGNGNGHGHGHGHGHGFKLTATVPVDHYDA